MKIVVLGGGLSTERHVSLVTATSVCKALRGLGHQAVFVDLFLGLEDYEGDLEAIFDTPDGRCGSVAIGHEAPDLEAVRASRRDQSPSRIGKNVLEVCRLADCVFLGLHGADGEDGKIQAALELLGVPYTGSGPLGSAMAMDKAVAKRIMESAGVLTPKWTEMTYTEEQIPELVQTMPLPCAVKVVGGGSSIGVCLPETREELEDALHQILRYGNRVVVEEKIRGRELTVPVLGDRALCPIEIVPRALGLAVYSRSDFILDSEGRAWCLEVNTLPGLTPSSLIPKAAREAGIEYPELCQTIVELSMKARGR